MFRPERPQVETKARDAEVVGREFARALVSRDPRAALAWFSATATILTFDGTQMTGHQRIEEVLKQIAEARQKLQISLGRTVVSGDFAHSTQFWRRSDAASDGSAYESSTTARLVLVHDGQWRIVILLPWD